MNTASHRELAFLSAARAAALVKSKEVSPVELVQACLGRIEALNPSLNAFISVTAAAALEHAKVILGLARAYEAATDCHKSVPAR